MEKEAEFCVGILGQTTLSNIFALLPSLCLFVSSLLILLSLVSAHSHSPVFCSYFSQSLLFPLLHYHSFRYLFPL